MKGPTPLKRHPAIVSFSKDHHFGLLLVWKIRQGLAKEVNAERISNYILFFFKEDLEKHFKDEEQLLFCKLPVNDALRMQAEKEHQSIYILISAIQKNKYDTDLICPFADDLERHIRFEERILFHRMIQKKLPQGLLITIKNRMKNGKMFFGRKNR